MVYYELYCYNINFRLNRNLFVLLFSCFVLCDFTHAWYFVECHVSRDKSQKQRAGQATEATHHTGDREGHRPHTKSHTEERVEKFLKVL